MKDKRIKLIVILAVIIVMAILPLVINLPTNISNLLILLFIFIALGQSWNIMGGYTGLINLGLAAFFGCGVSITHFVWLAGLPVYIAVIIGGMVTAILAVIIGFPTLRLKGVYFAIGTLALAEALRIIIGNVVIGVVRMPSIYTNTYDMTSRYYLGLIIALVSIAIVYFVMNSRLGLALTSTRDNEQAAQVTGVNTFKYRMYALIISAFMAGMAGGVYAFFRLSFNSLSLVFSPLWTFEPITAVIIGGAGTILGPVIGSAFMVILSEVFALTLGEAHLIIFGVLFILVVLYFPYGLVGSFDRIRHLITKARMKLSRPLKT